MARFIFNQIKSAYEENNVEKARSLYNRYFEIDLYKTLYKKAVDDMLAEAGIIL